MMDDSAKWAMVPVEPTPEMCEAATEIDVDTIVSKPTRLDWEEAAAVYAAMLAAAPPLPVDSDGWRDDLDAAPKDGSTVLLFGTFWPEAVAAQWSTWRDNLAKADRSGWREASFERVGDMLHGVTHWRPLPTPPVAPRG